MTYDARDATAIATAATVLYHLVTLSTYLTQRGKGRTWHLRVPVPRDYRRQHGGGAEKIRSLRTSDRALAIKRALPILSSWQAEWESRPGLVIQADNAGVHDVKAVAVKVAHDDFLEALEDRRRFWPSDPEGYAAMLAQRQREHRLFVQEFLQGNHSRWEPIADRAVAARNLPIIDGGARNEFVRWLAEAGIEALGLFIRRSQGELDAEPKSQLVRGAKRAAAARAAPGETLLDLFDAYVAWRCEPGRKQRRRPESFKQDRVAVELFSEFVGPDRAVQSIIKDDAKMFRAMLGDFPASRGKIQALRNAPISECVAMRKRDGLSALSLTTQAKYLSILSPFFDWLVSDAPVSVPTNVFDGLHHRLERGENRRPSFSAGQLNALLRSPLFDRCGGDRNEHVPGDATVRDWRYWIPLLCLFTGSRITEIAQLNTDDIDIRDDVPLVLLTHDEANGQFLKNKRGRLAALHNILVDAGFLAFWRKQAERAARDGNKQLFPGLVAGQRKLLGDQPSRWFRRYLERIGLKAGADGLGTHSFRHTMTDAMRNAGYMDIEFGQLVLGHSNNSITAAYGAVPQGTPARLQSMITAAFKSEPFRSVYFGSLQGDEACTRSRVE